MQSCRCPKFHSYHEAAFFTIIVLSLPQKDIKSTWVFVKSFWVYVKDAWHEIIKMFQILLIASTNLGNVVTYCQPWMWRQLQEERHLLRELLQLLACVVVTLQLLLLSPYFPFVVARWFDGLFLVFRVLSQDLRLSSRPQIKKGFKCAGLVSQQVSWNKWC